MDLRQITFDKVSAAEYYYMSNATSEVVMAESMTGYGRGEHDTGRYQFKVEIRSTNHRFLEFKLRFPRELNLFENEVRNAVRRRFSRGYLDIQASLVRLEASSRKFIIDRELLSQIAAGLQSAGRELGLGDQVDMATLSRFRELFSFEEEEQNPEEFREGLMAAVEAACAELKKGREREGQAIQGSVDHSLDLYRQLLIKMEAAAPEVNRRLKEGFHSRLQTLLGQEHISPERLEQEAAFLAVKSDVTEELARLRGHIAAFSNTRSMSGPVGRKMDFLLQEMHRELNTTAAKAGTLELSHLAIQGKLELEKIKEQVQNLE
jgi:uncharacterized protein (TIGR00255 family)